jgi:hypothetical protein
MLGIILWSDVEDKKAVIWCEDQGDLAFFQSGSEGLDQRDFFDAGDMVRFDLDLSSPRRVAINPRMVHPKVARSLPQELQAQASKGKIVKFPTS